jgi:aryl-alcohol dehydrogenase-like predicted oxidoreductase
MRSGTDKFGQGLYHQAEEASRKIVDAVAAIANERGVSRAQVALAWLLQKPAVTAPIVGVTKPEHLTDAIAAVDLKLSNDELRKLEEPYLPQRPEGF